MTGKQKPFKKTKVDIQENSVDQTSDIIENSIDNTTKSVSESNEELTTDQLLDKIADETFDILVSLFSGDKLAARDAFGANQAGINEFCQQIVSDVEAGSMKADQTREKLSKFLNELIK